jgi:hypothetical protein
MAKAFLEIINEGYSHDVVENKWSQNSDSGLRYNHFLLSTGAKHGRPNDFGAGG